MNRLRELRVRKNITQRQLAELVGTNQSRISLIEHGLHPTTEEVKKITRALGLDEDETSLRKK